MHHPGHHTHLLRVAAHTAHAHALHALHARHAAHALHHAAAALRARHRRRRRRRAAVGAVLPAAEQRERRAVAQRLLHLGVARPSARRGRGALLLDAAQRPHGRQRRALAAAPPLAELLVKVVLDGVVSAARQQLCDLRPAVAKQVVSLQQARFLRRRPRGFVYLRVARHHAGS